MRVLKVRTWTYSGTMSKQIQDGNKDKLRGKAREAVGKMNDDKGEQIHGKLEQAKGDAKIAIGKARRKL